MIVSIMAAILFLVALGVGLAVDHSRSMKGGIEPAWTALRPSYLKRALSTSVPPQSRLSRVMKRVLVYGSTETGYQLAREFGEEPGIDLIGIIDDQIDEETDRSEEYRRYPLRELDGILRKGSVSLVVLALPYRDAGRRVEAIRQLWNSTIHVQTVPNEAETEAGRRLIDQLRDLDIADLLDRSAAHRDDEAISELLAGQTVMVTGAGGSIGAELCTQIVRIGARRLVLFDVSELALRRVNRKLARLIAQESHNVEIIPLIGNARNQARLKEGLEAYGVRIMFHAATYTSVPLIEYNMVEGISNNVFGTLSTARAAVSAGVEHFVFLSSDKAVYPTSVAGASLRIAEQILQSLNLEEASTQFTVVRFGNVIESNGSVVSSFKEQIRHGGPVTVTHPDVIRYFMTAGEAVSLILAVLTKPAEGDLFVFDMGEPVKIIDLARKMIQLSGFTVRDLDHPSGDIEVQVTGLRPGEKLYEELLIGNVVVHATSHPRIMRVREDFVAWQELQTLLDELESACTGLDRHRINDLIRRIVPDYRPASGVSDLVWQRLAQAEGLESLGSEYIYEKAVGEPAGLANIVKLEAYRKR